jgi:serine/threonine protein kinase
MTDPMPCIPDPDLRQFKDGSLAAGRREMVESHLDTCPDCLQRYDRLSGRQDKLLDRLRQAAHQEPPERPQMEDDAIPGYEIIRELKSGGQGVVYQAIQQSTKRKVAIKVLLAGQFASKAARRRFDREIELVAQLRHPDIIVIFDSGATSTGMPFYAMDYVRGKPLDEFFSTGPRSLEDVLGLFVRICNAVQFAHHRGVIHRDLKPSNILVDSMGNPKLLDFGLAKNMAAPLETMLSMSDMLVGTLAYMSPEQAQGSNDTIDTRTDIYSLGVLLYKSLTGKHPYLTSGPVHTVIRHITETPPAPLTRSWSGDTGIRMRHTRSLKAGQCPIDDELETIVLKALSKEPSRRYSSAHDLALDLQRYVSGEPIAAKADSSWYLLRATVRRHRKWVALLATCSLAIVACLVISLFFWAEAVHERNRVLTEVRRVEHIRSFLEQALSPEELRFEKGAKITFRDILDAAAKRADTAFADQPISAAVIHATLAESYEWPEGQFAAAEHHLREALGLRTQHLGHDHSKTINTMSRLGDLMYRTGRYVEGEALLRTALSWHLTHESSAQDTAHAETRLAWCLEGQCRFDEALPLFRKAIDRRRNATAGSTVPSGTDLSGLGKVLYYTGRYAEAEQTLRESIEAKLSHGAPASTEFSLNILGAVLTELGRVKEAREVLDEALAIAERLSGEHHPHMEQSLYRSANLHFSVGQPERAAPLVRRLLAIRGEMVKKKSPVLGELLVAAEAQVTTLAKLPGATALVKQLVTLGRKQDGYTSPHVAAAMHSPARHFCAAGAHRAGIVLLNESLRIQRATLIDRHLAIATTLTALGQAHLDVNAPEAAHPRLVEALECRRAALPPENWLLARTLTLLGRCLRELDRTSEALTALFEADRIFSNCTEAPIAHVRSCLEELIAVHNTLDGHDAQPFVHRLESLSPATHNL